MRDLVAGLDQQFFHHAGLRAGDVHGGLVRLHGDQGGVQSQAVAGLDQDVDDLDILEAADVRQLDFDAVAHGSISKSFL